MDTKFARKCALSSATKSSRIRLGASGLIRSARMSILVGVAALPFLAAPAYSVTLTDNYLGGLNTYPGAPDVIGPSNVYNTTSVDVTRSGVNNDTLNITIHTFYAGQAGTDNTGYGSLFFSTAGINPLRLGAGSANDQYQPNDWNYVFKLPVNPGAGSIPQTSSGLYAIGSVTNTNLYPQNTSVVQSYTTQNGVITMSNVNGDPVTYPGTNNPRFYFRQGQAVQFDPNNGVNPADTGTYAINATSGATEGSIVISILDNGLLGDSFTLMWAMTCANDVIEGTVNLPPGENFPTPLPATFPLFAGGLGAMSLLGWRRKKRNGSAV